jgi:hypothetical protein
VGFAGAFKGEGRGSREGARSGKGRRGSGRTLHSRWRKEEERKEEEALPGGVRVPEGERVRESARRGGHASGAELGCARGGGGSDQVGHTRERERKGEVGSGEGNRPKGKRGAGRAGLGARLAFPISSPFLFLAPLKLISI